MQKSVYLCLFFVLFTATLSAKTIAVVVSRKLPIYEQALQGIKEKLANRQHTVFFLDASANVRRTRERLRAYPFDCYIPIGGAATREVITLAKNKIVVCCLTLYEPKESSAKFHVVPYLPPGAELAKKLKKLQPSVLHRIGTIWCHDSLRDIIHNYKEDFKLEQCPFVVTKVDSPREVPRALKKLAKRIDAFLLLPEPSLMQKEALRHVLLTLLQKGKVIIAFSPSLVRAGALFSLSYPPKKIGRYAGQLAIKLLFEETEDVEMPKLEFSKNERVARFLGIKSK